MKLVNQVITLDESKKCSEQPNYQKPSVFYEISQPSNNTRWVKKRSEQSNHQEPSDQTTKNL